MAPFPTPQEITSMFSNFGHDGGAFMAHLDPDVNVHVMGHEHSTRNSHASHKAVAEDFFGQFQFVDWDATEFQVTLVIGGGESEWAAVELKGVGKSKKGKHINQEGVWLTRFNTSGKIVEIKVHYDTAHLESHFEDHRKK